MFKLHFKGISYDQDVWSAANLAFGLTGSEVETAINLAKRKLMRNLIESNGKIRGKISKQDLVECFNEIRQLK